MEYRRPHHMISSKDAWQNLHSTSAPSLQQDFVPSQRGRPWKSTDWVEGMADFESVVTAVTEILHIRCALWPLWGSIDTAAGSEKSILSALSSSIYP